MDIIKTLNEIQYLKMESKYTEDKIRELKERRTSIKSTSDLGVTPGSHVSNPNNDNCLNMMTSIKDLEVALEKDLSMMYSLEKEVTKVMEQLEPKKRIIIKLHYFEGEAIEYICGVIGYSFRHTARMHKEALDELKKLAWNGIECPQNKW